MKINPLDAHDRLLHFKKQDFDIAACCQDLLNQRPFGSHPFYIFVHPRTDDDGVTKRLIWQPRLTKPKAQTNSMLFKGDPKTDIIKIIWMIPPRELWAQYEKDKLIEDSLISESIYDFQHNRGALEAKEEDDLTDEQIDAVYRQLAIDAKWRKRGMIKLTT